MRAHTGLDSLKKHKANFLLHVVWMCRLLSCQPDSQYAMSHTGRRAKVPTQAEMIFQFRD
jgi:hypothetical protein